MKTILVVDDDDDICSVLEMLFTNDGYRVETASNGKAAIERLAAGDRIDLIVSDLKMPVLGGKAIQEYLAKSSKNVPILFITAYGTIPEAVETIKKGAIDYITKPFEKNVIRHVVRRMLESSGSGCQKKTENGAAPDFVYRSAQMRTIVETIRKVSARNSPVLILGKSGTGKEMVARALHSLDPAAPFVKVSCPSIPGTLLESELFGYRKGAFTGASSNFLGKAKAADGGILFLDEIGDLPLELQPKLLRLIEERAFDPLGSIRSEIINTRIVCATNRDLKELVAGGGFREDLYYRINAVCLTIPALGERPDDILPIARYYLDRFCSEQGIPPKSLAPEAEQALLRYRWPGNVRELRNAIERVAVLAGSDRVEVDDLPREIAEGAGPAEPRDLDRLSSAERTLIADALGRTRGNVSEAAKVLGISRDTLRYRVRKYGLEPWPKHPALGDFPHA